MNFKILIGGAVAAVSGAVAAVAGAARLFNSAIPRQNGVRIDMSEMADLDHWKDYRKIINESNQWLLARKCEELVMYSDDGLRLRAKYFPCDAPTNRIVLACHGYTSHSVSEFASLARFYNKLGFGCVVPDLRAHGESDGDYIGFGVLDRYDCLCWLDYILDKFGKNTQIVIHGTGLGGSAALMASGFPNFPKQVKCIIADSAFTSPHDIFAHILKRDYKLPSFPILNIADAICHSKAGYGFKDFSTLDAVRVSDCPVLFIHGREDKFVPAKMSVQNYKACSASKELLIVANAGHGASRYEHTSLYEDKTKAFIEKWVL